MPLPDHTLSTGSEPVPCSISPVPDANSTVETQSAPNIDGPAPSSTTKSDDLDLFNSVQTILSTYLTSSPLYKILLSSILLSSASHGHVTLKLVVLPVHVNSKAILHGSLSATLVDLVGGLAIASTGSKTGVSTDLHVSFVGSAREGDTLWVEGFAERVGATLAFTRVRVEKESPGGERVLVATGSHTKYVR
ncbi:4HBT domain-containing protein [Mycena venus]|uniref:4HBT domain-containing protein n=1 Tax=Mycena venus TaxID=2733690 RepID=A0A8H7CW25_9AGAR|nr:4HBT domain-containing protein [Mycena venus]